MKLPGWSGDNNCVRFSHVLSFSVPFNATHIVCISKPSAVPDASDLNWNLTHGLPLSSHWPSGIQLSKWSWNISTNDFDDHKTSSEDLTKDKIENCVLCFTQWHRQVVKPAVGVESIQGEQGRLIFCPVKLNRGFGIGVVWVWVLRCKDMRVATNYCTLL